MDQAERQEFTRELRESNRRKLAEGRAELTRRMMTMPLQDPVQKWREDADERERQRKAERAEIERGWRREIERDRKAATPPPPDAARSFMPVC